MTNYPVRSAREVLQEWFDMVAKESPTEFEPETIDLSQEGVMVTSVGDKFLDSPEKILKVEHKADGTADIHTDNHIFTNVWPQGVDMSGPADMEPTSISVKLEYSNFETKK